MLEITITSDFICPWCHIGAARLAEALRRAAPSTDVSIEWAPFELNPGMPAAGMSRQAYRSRKFGSWKRSVALDAHTLDASRDDAVAFRYDRIERTPNTFAAHRLASFAAGDARQHDVATGLLHAYFVTGLDIGERSVLETIAERAGLDRDRVAAHLDGDEGVAALRERIDRARRRIRGVPHFDIGGISVEGAQATALLTDVVRQAARSLAVPTTSERDADVEAEAVGRDGRLGGVVLDR